MSGCEFTERHLGPGKRHHVLLDLPELDHGSNPFGHLKGITVKGNAERFRFVTHEEIQSVIDAAPCVEWRAIIALARYGGLRTPSETLALKWSDVDWERQRLRIPSPKTAHVGKSFRVAPLFSELEPYLRDAFELAADGSEFVINRYRDASQNLRTTRNDLPT